MPEIAKTFILIGVIFIFVGGVLFLAGKIPWLGRLPGDIVIKRENFTFYFPLMTSVAISILLTIIFYFLNRR